MSTTPRNNRRRKTSLLSKARWAGYAAAGAATALGTYEAAEAEIWWSGLLNNGQGIRMDTIGPTGLRSYLVDLPGSQDLLMIHTQMSSLNGRVFGVAAANSLTAGLPDNKGNWAKIAGVPVGAFYNADLFLSNAPINSTQRQFWYFGTLASDNNPGFQFRDPGEGIIGFSFVDNAETRYGWLRVNMEGGTDNAYSILEFAYAEAGEGIVAGQTESVPEPGSLGLLAVGGTGLLLWRRKRRQSQTSD